MSYFRDPGKSVLPEVALTKLLLEHQREGLYVLISPDGMVYSGEPKIILQTLLRKHGPEEFLK